MGELSALELGRNFHGCMRSLAIGEHDDEHGCISMSDIVSPYMWSSSYTFPAFHTHSPFPGHQPVSLVSPAEPLVQHSQGLEECPCKEGPCKEKTKTPCKEGNCRPQGDQGRGDSEEEVKKVQGEDESRNVLVRVRYRGETRLLRPQGMKVELDSLQEEVLALKSGSS